MITFCYHYSHHSFAMYVGFGLIHSYEVFYRTSMLFKTSIFKPTLKCILAAYRYIFCINRNIEMGEAKHVYQKPLKAPKQNHSGL